MKYYLESLGCPKNLVDAQGISRLLKHLGYEPVDDPRLAQVLIVNTCGFIEDARDESLGELQTLARQKRDGQVLIAAGCLSQRWGEALSHHVPELDALLGTRRWHEIGSLIRQLRAGQVGAKRDLVTLLDDAAPGPDGDGRRFARQGASAYLKIADGCSAPCAFCAIPLIKGPAVSLPARAIVENAVELVQQGVKELVLIAQDTTAYARDRGERDALPDLVQAILREVSDPHTPGDGREAEGPPGLHWLRLMYAYPGHVSPRLIEVMAREPRVCNYLDLPLQHAHRDVLRRMKRPANLKRTRRLIRDLRAAMPDLALRTSFIVGYPGETEQEFQELLDFVTHYRPDRVGVFVFSAEEGTAAAALPNPVPEEIKAERYDRLMALQQQISLESNQAQVGRTLDVLVEGSGDGLNVGRSYRDAPEIDGLVFVPGDAASGIVGTVRSVHITGAMEYDLVGEFRASGEVKSKQTHPAAVGAQTGDGRQAIDPLPPVMGQELGDESEERA